VLEEGDSAHMVRAARIVVQPFMQGGARREDSKEQHQCNATAGHQSGEERMNGARALLQENHDPERRD
jgi:hypothetical protein